LSKTHVQKLPELGIQLGVSCPYGDCGHAAESRDRPREPATSIETPHARLRFRRAFLPTWSFHGRGC